MIVSMPQFPSSMEQIGCSPVGVFRVRLSPVSRRPRRFQGYIFRSWDVKPRDGKLRASPPCALRRFFGRDFSGFWGHGVEEPRCD